MLVSASLWLHWITTYHVFVFLICRLFVDISNTSPWDQDKWFFIQEKERSSFLQSSTRKEATASLNSDILWIPSARKIGAGRDVFNCVVSCIYRGHYFLIFFTIVLFLESIIRSGVETKGNVQTVVTRACFTILKQNCKYGGMYSPSLFNTSYRVKFMLFCISRRAFMEIKFPE